MWVDKEMEKPTYVHSVQGGNESKLTSETLWESLKAVKEKHAHKVDADMFYLVCASQRPHPCLNPSWVPGKGAVVLVHIV